MALHQIQCVAVPAFAGLVVMMPTLVRAQTPELPGAEVHGVGPFAAEIVREGREQSPTFRRLVNELESSDWIVFVQTGSCRLPRILGCLLHRVGTFDGRRYMRIVLSDVSRTRDEAIATIGHELQHAAEVVNDVPPHRVRVNPCARQRSLRDERRRQSLCEDTGGTQSRAAECCARADCIAMSLSLWHQRDGS